MNLFNLDIRTYMIPVQYYMTRKNSYKIRILQGMARGVVTVTFIKGMIITLFDCIVEYMIT